MTLRIAMRCSSFVLLVQFAYCSKGLQGSLSTGMSGRFVVRQVIRRERPQTVLVELCPLRAHLLRLIHLALDGSAPRDRVRNRHGSRSPLGDAAQGPSLLHDRDLFSPPPFDTRQGTGHFFTLPDPLVSVMDFCFSGVLELSGCLYEASLFIALRACVRA